MVLRLGDGTGTRIWYWDKDMVLRLGYGTETRVWYWD